MILRFRNFTVYQEAKKLHKEVVTLANNFPSKFYYLADQIKRSSLSAVLNIAEGSAKRSDKDFNRYLENSMGSVNETISCLEVALDNRLIVQKAYEDMEQQYSSVVKQLGGFSRSLLK